MTISDGRITEDYRVLHKVAQILQAEGNLMDIMQNVMQALTSFEDLKVENKAGIFLADNEKNVLRLLSTYGEFSQEFLEKENEVPFGSCLCGRVAQSGELMMSENCFTDPRHERMYDDMTPHGHYIVPLKSSSELVGVLFLYSNTHPAWYQNSQEVLLSIGSLIAEAIQKKQTELELAAYRDQLESLVEARASELKKTNANLRLEIEGHKKTQEHLKKSRDQFRKLSNQIQNIREEEKTRIAREVHDQLGQSLTALKIDSAHIAKKLPAELTDLKSQAETMTGIIDDTIKSVQQIATDLRPPILDAFGLCDAITWQAREYEKRFPLKFEVNCEQVTLKLDPGLQVALFRVFQEAVINVVRHAQAAQVTASLKVNNEELILLIEDNGIGIKKDNIENFESLGLMGMQERVYPFKGKVAFTGQPGKGTTVTITIPLVKQ